MKKILKIFCTILITCLLIGLIVMICENNIIYNIIQSLETCEKNVVSGDATLPIKRTSLQIAFILTVIINGLGFLFLLFYKKILIRIINKELQK